MTDTLPWSRQFYEEGGWDDGRIGQAYDLLAAVLKDRGERTYQHPLLVQIETMDEGKAND